MKVPVIAIAILLCTTVAAQPLAEDSLQFDRYVNSSLYLRKAVNDSRVFYLNDDQGTYYYFTDNRRYLYGEHQSVRIIEIETSPTGKEGWRRRRRPRSVTFDPFIEVQFSNELLGNQLLFISSEKREPLSNEQFIACMETAFLQNPIEDTFKYYFTDGSTEMIHSTLCDHSLNGAVDYHDAIMRADSSRLCHICFQEDMGLPDIEIERYLGQIAADYHLGMNIRISDDVLIRRVDTLAAIVLDNWPLALRGYDYNFLIVANDDPNALACPGGKVFLNTGLIESLDDLELMAILAHEIAHVEFRHGYRQYKSQQKTGFWSGLAAGTLGTLAGIITDDVEVAFHTFDIAGSIANLFGEIALMGYSRKYEREADGLALLFLSRAMGGDSQQYLAQALRKIRYYANELPHESTHSAFSTHPGIASRLKTYEQTRFTLCPEPVQYVGYDRFGNLAATFSIVAISRLCCYGELQTTVYLRDPCEVKHFEFGRKDDPKSCLRLDNEEDTKMIPGRGIGMVFYGSLPAGFPRVDSLEFAMPLKNVERWEPVP